MTKDKLKSFIDAHKEEFDSELPRVDLWDDIEKELDAPPDVISMWRFVPYAAAVALLISIGLFFFNQSSIENTAENTLNEDFGLSGFSEELHEVEQYYLVQVNDRLQDLAKYEVDEELLTEVNELKKEFDELKLEMGVGADPTKVIEAMIDNYRLRLSLLEDLLEAMERAEQFNNETNETTL